MVEVVAVDTGASLEDQRTEVLTLIGFLSYFAPMRDAFLERGLTLPEPRPDDAGESSLFRYEGFRLR